MRVSEYDYGLPRRAYSIPRQVLWLWMNSPRMWTEKQEIRWGKDVGVERHRLREILRTKNCAILDVCYTLILNPSFTLWNSAAYTRSTQKAVP